jgi:hypothetical protein
MSNVYFCNMDILEIQPTAITPFVLFDPFLKEFLIEGESRPEHAGKFYEPLVLWLNEFHKSRLWENKTRQSGSNEVVFNFNLQYFNSTSAKYILDIIKLLEAFNKDGCTVKLNWFYDLSDDDMKESGEEFAQLVNYSFKFIKKV